MFFQTAALEIYQLVPEIPKSSFAYDTFLQMYTYINPHVNISHYGVHTILLRGNDMRVGRQS